MCFYYVLSRSVGDGANRSLAKEEGGSMQFHTMSNVTPTEDSAIQVTPSASNRGAALSSSSHQEKSRRSGPQEEQRLKKKGAAPSKKLESVSLDKMSDTSSKKFW